MKKCTPKNIKQKKAVRFNKKMERLGKCNVDSNGNNSNLSKGIQ